MGERRGTKALELWCRRMTEGYPGVKIENMTTSWRDGLAFCAMIHHFRPDLIEFEKLNKADVYYNNDLAFRTAERHLGIPALLDADDMASYEVPDRLSILTYLSQFYQVFASSDSHNRLNNKRPSAVTEKASNAKPSGPPPKMAHIVGVPKRDPCQKCGLPVFLAERLMVGKNVYHRTCLRCARCNSQLTLGSFYETEIDGEYCCETCPDEEKKLNVATSSKDREFEIMGSVPIADRLAFFEKDGNKVLQKSLSDEEKSQSLKKLTETQLESIYKPNTALQSFVSSHLSGGYDYNSGSDSRRSSNSSSSSSTSSNKINDDVSLEPPELPKSLPPFVIEDKVWDPPKLKSTLAYQNVQQISGNNTENNQIEIATLSIPPLHQLASKDLSDVGRNVNVHLESQDALLMSEPTVENIEETVCLQSFMSESNSDVDLGVEDRFKSGSKQGNIEETETKADISEIPTTQSQSFRLELNANKDLKSEDRFKSGSKHVNIEETHPKADISEIPNTQLQSFIFEHNSNVMDMKNQDTLKSGWYENTEKTHTNVDNSEILTKQLQPFVSDRNADMNLKSEGRLKSGSKYVNIEQNHTKADISEPPSIKLNSCEPENINLDLKSQDAYKTDSEVKNVKKTHVETGTSKKSIEGLNKEKIPVESDIHGSLFSKLQTSQEQYRVVDNTGSEVKTGEEIHTKANITEIPPLQLNSCVIKCNDDVNLKSHNRLKSDSNIEKTHTETDISESLSQDISAKIPYMENIQSEVDMCGALSSNLEVPQQPIKEDFNSSSKVENIEEIQTEQQKLSSKLKILQEPSGEDHQSIIKVENIDKTQPEQHKLSAEPLDQQKYAGVQFHDLNLSIRSINVTKDSSENDEQMRTKREPIAVESSKQLATTDAEEPAVDIPSASSKSMVRARRHQFEVIANKSQDSSISSLRKNRLSDSTTTNRTFNVERLQSGETEVPKIVSDSDSDSSAINSVANKQQEKDASYTFIEDYSARSGTRKEEQENSKVTTEYHCRDDNKNSNRAVQSDLSKVKPDSCSFRDRAAADSVQKVIQKGKVQVEVCGDYPAELNPFKSDDEEDNEDFKCPIPVVNSMKKSGNPFESSDEEGDDKREENTSTKSLRYEEMKIASENLLGSEKIENTPTNPLENKEMIIYENLLGSEKIDTSKNPLENEEMKITSEIPLENQKIENTSTNSLGSEKVKKISTNPFGSESESEEDNNVSNSSETSRKVPVPTPRSSNSRLSQNVTPASQKGIFTACEGVIQRTKDCCGKINLGHEVKQSPKSTYCGCGGGTNSLNRKKKAPAPPPPKVSKELFSSINQDSKKSSPGSSTASTPTPMRKKRPAPAPPGSTKNESVLQEQKSMRLSTIETDFPAEEDVTQANLPAQLDKLCDEEKALLESGPKISSNESSIISLDQGNEGTKTSQRRLIALDISLVEDANSSEDLKLKEEDNVIYRRTLVPPVLDDSTLSPSLDTSESHDRQLEKMKDNKEAKNRNRQSQISLPSEENDPLYNKSVHGKWKRRKGPAPALPIPPKKVLQMLPLQEIRHELEIIEVQQQGLEKQGVMLEKMIRERCEGPTSGDNTEENPNPPNSKEVEDLILQLFELVNEKNELFRRQAELMYLRRQHRLEQEQADLEYEIRVLMAQPERNKTDSDKAREEALIARLVEVVQLRNEVVECLEMDRLREAEEDLSIKQRLEMHSAKRDEELSKQTPTKLSKKEKKKQKEHKKIGKSKKLDADKDADESELNAEKQKAKKKKKKFLF